MYNIGMLRSIPITHPGLRPHNQEGRMKHIILCSRDFHRPPEYHMDMWADLCETLGKDPETTDSITVWFDPDKVETD